ncbi:hypothetical protein ACFLZ0_00825 [Patescibacteria group bacterium]
MLKKLACLLVVLMILGISTSSKAVECNQFVEKKNGNLYSAYPYRITTPINCECGNDSDDIVLEYCIVGRNLDPSKFRWWSPLWWVRSVVGISYPSGISANGLCTNQVRVCIGSKAKWLGYDLMYLYLWYEN